MTDLLVEKRTIPVSSVDKERCYVNPICVCDTFDGFAPLQDGQCIAGYYYNDDPETRCTHETSSDPPPDWYLEGLAALATGCPVPEPLSDGNPATGVTRQITQCDIAYAAQWVLDNGPPPFNDDLTTFDGTIYRLYHIITVWWVFMSGDLSAANCINGNIGGQPLYPGHGSTVIGMALIEVLPGAVGEPTCSTVTVDSGPCVCPPT